MMELHVTDIDGMLWFTRMESMGTEDMVDRLMRVGSVNDKMLMGTAWHKILEDPPPVIESCHKWGFDFEVNCEAEIKLPLIRETRASKTYPVCGMDVGFTGKCDGTDGLILYDHKLTFGDKLDSYFSSYQWRAYLDIFNAEVFVYYIYFAKSKGKAVRINDIAELRFYRYPGMVRDLTQGMSDLVSFVIRYVPELIEGE